MTTDFSLYYVAQAADEAWSRELEEVYGHLGVNCGNARYDSRGRGTPELEALYQAKIAADAAWAAECRGAVVEVKQTRNDPRFRVVKVIGKVQ